MKAFLKNLGAKLLKGAANVAKEQAKEILKDEIAPYLTKQLIVSSKELLFKQMDTLLESVKSYLMELKLKTKTTSMPEDEQAFNYALYMLKEFSKSVIVTIDDIEAY